MPIKSKPGARLKLNSLLLTDQDYKQIADKHIPSKNILRNCIRAFLVGGLICLIGQCIGQLFMTFAGMSSVEVGNPTVAILIIISVVLTSFGIYDKIAQWAGAGTAVPVTGFANSMCSAALEYRTEGWVLGVGANMFKLAGSVIVFGVFAAFIVGVIYIIFGLGGA